MLSTESSLPSFFPPLEGIGKEATAVYKSLEDMFSRKLKKPYSVVTGWLRCKLTIASVCMAIMCIHGTRWSNNRPLREADITLAASEVGILQDKLDCFICLFVCSFYKTKQNKKILHKYNIYLMLYIYIYHIRACGAIRRFQSTSPLKAHYVRLLVIRCRRRSNTAMPGNTAIPLFLNSYATEEIQYGDVADSELFCMRVATLLRNKYASIRKVMSSGNACQNCQDFVLFWIFA